MPFHFLKLSFTTSRAKLALFLRKLGAVTELDVYKTHISLVEWSGSKVIEGVHCTVSRSKTTVYSRRHSAPIAVIAGGGSGHEPAHAGYTGANMLAASVAGDIFASPSASQILTAIQIASIRHHDSPHFRDPQAEKSNDRRPVLLIINNYTGDRLNFGLAAERARALPIPIPTESFIVSDDVSLLTPTQTESVDPRTGLIRKMITYTSTSLVGPRGLGGNILVCKILGAAASTYGEDLGLLGLKTFGELVVENLGSIGVGLGHCHVPGRLISSDSLRPNECELGMGLHNEPGAFKITLSEDNPDELIRTMIERVLSAKGPEFVLEGDDVVLFVNNLGGMSQLEMGAVLEATMTTLESNHSIRPSNVLSSSFMTSLNAPGFSISIFNASAVQRDLPARLKTSSLMLESCKSINVLDLIRMPTNAFAWPNPQDSSSPSQLSGSRGLEEKLREAEELVNSLRVAQAIHQRRSEPELRDSHGTKNGDTGTDLGVGAYIPRPVFDSALRAACQAVLAAEDDMTAFDTVLGDGDCGRTFAEGAKALLRSLDDGNLDTSLDVSNVVERISELLENSMGGTSGALLGIYLTSLCTSLRSINSVSGSGPDPPSTWRQAPKQALEALSQYTPAREGDRTIVDALGPFCQTLAASLSSSPLSSIADVLSEAARQAHDGAERTRGMNPRLGRATYVVGNEHGKGGDDDKEGLPPDPGAWGVAAIVEGLVKGFKVALI